MLMLRVAILTCSLAFILLSNVACSTDSDPGTGAQTPSDSGADVSESDGSAASGGSAGAPTGAAGAGGGAPAASYSNRIIGYLPAYRDLAAWTNRIAYSRLTHLNIAFGNPDANNETTLSATDAELDTLIRLARSEHVKVLISIGGGSGSGSVSARLSPDIVDEYVSKLVAFVDRHDLDGVDVDIEGPAVDQNYGPFIDKLRAALDFRSKLMTAALATWFGDSISDATLGKFDFINVMSYDHCGPWSGPCQQSTYQQAIDDLGYFSGQRRLGRDKLVLGVPFYGWCWGSGCSGSAISYGQLLELFPDAWQTDWVESDGMQISYNGEVSIRLKAALAQSHGGFMMWELTQDAMGTRSLLNVIAEALVQAPP